MTEPAIAKLLDPRGIDQQPFERVAVELISLVQRPHIERTRDAIQIICDPEEIGPVILVTPEAVEFRLPTASWVHPHISVPSSKLWRRVPNEEVVLEDLRKLIALARTARKKQFKSCRFCGEKVPPEHRHSGDVCHGCSEQHLGVVH